jgi:hypothetical protein
MPPLTKQSRTLEQGFRKWMKQQGKDPAALTYDNQPKGFLNAFPAKNANLMENAWRERLWWWRCANRDNGARVFRQVGFPQWPCIMQPLFRHYFQEGAYFYELHARYDERYHWDFDRPWILCSNEHRRYLECLLPNAAPPAVWLPSQKDKANWVKLTGVSFNLEVNNSILQGQFLEEIERLRTCRNILPPGKGKGVRRKPVSFLPLELLDRRYYLRCKLNHSERSAVSKTMKAYEATCEKLKLTP